MVRTPRPSSSGAGESSGPPAGRRSEDPLVESRAPHDGREPRVSPHRIEDAFAERYIDGPEVARAGETFHLVDGTGRVAERQEKCEKDARTIADLLRGRAHHVHQPESGLAIPNEGLELRCRHLP